MTDETDTERAVREAYAGVVGAAERWTEDMGGDWSLEAYPPMVAALAALDADIRADHEAELAAKVPDHKGVAEVRDVYAEDYGPHGSDVRMLLGVLDDTRAALTAVHDQLAARDEVFAELQSKLDDALHTFRSVEDTDVYRELHAAHEQTKRELGEARAAWRLTDECRASAERELDAIRAERDEALRKLNHEAYVSEKRAEERNKAERERDTLRAERDEARKDHDYALGVEVRMAGQAVASQSELEARIATLTKERAEMLAALDVPIRVAVAEIRSLSKSWTCFPRMQKCADDLDAALAAAKAETKEG